MKLLLTADAVGGVWGYATDLARALAPLGVETVLAVTGPSPDAAQRATAAALPATQLIDTGLALDWLAAGPADLMAAGARLAELATAHEVDLVQLNAPALAAGAPFTVPVIAVAHSSLATWWAAVESGPPPADFAWRDRLTRAGLLAADLVVAPTSAHAEATRHAHDLPFCPVTVHNGRHPLPLPPQNLPADAVFTAGRLWDRGKDLATLDRAAGLLSVPVRAAGPLVGPQGERAHVTQLSALGMLDEKGLAAELARRPIFVSTARYEPFGLAVLEAAQAGCALVLTDLPGFRELWKNTAMFVRPGDAAAVAAAVEGLLTDPRARQAAGAAAARQAVRYTPDAMASAMLDHYRALVRQPRRRSAA